MKEEKRPWKEPIEKGRELSKSVLCPAKINLFLEITGRREDGYHTIDSVMQKVSLCDRVDLTLSAGEGVFLTCNDKTLPTGEKNLAVRAANAYLKEAGIAARVTIFLYKRIPVAAGLAGGSTDAAGVLWALHSLTGALSQASLASLALSLGADVPFCLFGSSAVCRSLGEDLTPCPGLADCYLVIAKHKREAVSTKEAYHRIDSLCYTPLTSDALVLSLREKMPEKTGALMYNRFEEAILPTQPHAQKAKEILLAEGAFAAMMSGSGPSVFGLFKEKTKAQAAQAMLRALSYYAFLARPWR